MVRITLITFFVLSLASAVIASTEPPQDVTQTFDVRELLAPVPRFTGDVTGGLKGGNPPAQREAPDTSTEELASNVLAAIHLALEEGAVPQSLEIRDGQLIAKGAAAQVAAVAEVIAQFKRQRSVQINAEVRLLVVSDDAVKELPEALKRKIGRSRISPQPLQPAEVEVLTGRLGNGVEGLTAPNLTLLNQQTASVQVTSNQFYNADFKRDDEGNWKPVVGTAWTGIQVKIRAAAKDDGSQVSAEIEGALQRVLGFDEAALEGTDLVKQTPKLERLEFDRIAIGDAPVLLDAKFLRKRDEDADKPGILLVLVQLTPIVEREAAKPALQSRWAR